MATSSIGMTTVVKRENGTVLLDAVRRYKQMARSGKRPATIGSVSEVRAVGMRR